ncbi:unnamed protein product [[Candida] boidinii]|nr:unnamed protein product [[Candida] boidinii]
MKMNSSNQLNFQDVPVQSLESLRPRLTQLNHSLHKLEESIKKNQTLPNFSFLQNQFNVILSQLTSLSTSLDSNNELLNNTNVYPNSEFPVSLHENLLTTMLRKKHLPEVAEWIENSLNLTKDEIDKDEEKILKNDDEFSSNCLKIIDDELEDHLFGGFLTKSEIENNESSNSEFEYDSNKTNGPPKGLNINDVYRLIYQGKDSKLNVF